MIMVNLVEFNEKYFKFTISIYCVQAQKNRKNNRKDIYRTK